MTKVSVIIPCYNQGHFVDEAVDSVLAQTFADLEIIIVNDGSTDPATNRILRDYKKPKTCVLHTKNHRLGGARNNGIRAASGEYILPLDADDRIGTTYVEQAVRALESDPNLGIAYCEAEYFGARTGKWDLPPYGFPDILLGNSIFCTALFRKSDWEAVGGYRTDLSLWEDYDFWLSIIELGRTVHQIPEVLFYYRQHPDSMLSKAAKQQRVFPYGQIMRNHPKLFFNNSEIFAEHILALRRRIVILEDTITTMRRSRFYKLGQFFGR